MALYVLAVLQHVGKNKSIYLVEYQWLFLCASAGGAVRSVLELAGVQNVLAKRLGSRSCLNNARVTLKALSELRTMDDYAAARGIPLEYMLS